MDRGEALLKGIPWTDFADVPQVFKNIYTLLLVTDQITYHVVRETNSFEQCCEYWFNNQLINIVDKLEKEGGQ